MTYTFASAQGNRDYQEDFHFHTDTGKADVFGVLDGHGGIRTAQYANDRMPGLVGYFGFPHCKPIEEQIRLAINDIMLQTRHFEEGSTLSMVVIPKNSKTVYTAVLGDSPIYLLNDKWNYCVEHNIRTNEAEVEAASKRGARFYRGYMFDKHSDQGLQLSRSLGDCALDKVLSREPDIQVYHNVRKVLLGTDGVVDSSHADDPCSSRKWLCVALKHNASAATVIASSLGDDNATAYVIQL